MLVRHDFDRAGIAYVESYLAANGDFGKQLGPLLLASHDVEAGNVWAFLPTELPAARQAPLTDFAAGGLMLTALPPHLPQDRGTISRAELAHLAENAVAVVIGAWDDEGLIFWEPGRAT